MPGPTDSEFAIFQKLANPAKTDFSKRRRPPSGSIFSKKKGSTASVLSRHSTFSTHSAKPRASLFSTASVVNKTHNDDDSRHSTFSDSDSDQMEDIKHSPDMPGDDFVESSFPFAGFGDSPVFNAALNNMHGVDEPVNAGQDFHGDPGIHDEIIQEKEVFLAELAKFKEDGIVLTRDFSMGDSLESIQFEYNRIRANIETRRAIPLMFGGIMLGVKGIEWGNRKLGGILRLDGWGHAVEEDKDMYNYPLERLYKQHWRKRTSRSPVTEIGQMLAMSAAKYHLDEMTDGGGRPPASGDGQTGSKPKDFNSMMGGMKGMLSGVMNMFGGNGGNRKQAASGPVPFPTKRRPVEKVNIDDLPVMRGPTSTSPFIPSSHPQPMMQQPPPPPPQRETGQVQRVEQALKEKDQELTQMRQEQADQRHQMNQALNNMHQMMLQQQQSFQMEKAQMEDMMQQALREQTHFETETSDNFVQSTVQDVEEQAHAEPQELHRVVFTSVTHIPQPPSPPPFNSDDRVEELEEIDAHNHDNSSQQSQQSEEEMKEDKEVEEPESPVIHVELDPPRRSTRRGKKKKKTKVEAISLDF